MKAALFTFLIALTNPYAQAEARDQTLARATVAELPEAKEEATAELSRLNREFQVTVRDRVAGVETLPGAEVVEPWILATPEISQAANDLTSAP